MRSKVGVPLIEVIPDNRLPTELQVLGHYLWRMRNRCKKSVNAIARHVVQTVMTIWDAAYIPTISLQNATRTFYSKKSGILKR